MVNISVSPAVPGRGKTAEPVREKARFPVRGKRSTRREKKRVEEGPFFLFRDSLVRFPNTFLIEDRVLKSGDVSSNDGVELRPGGDGESAYPKTLPRTAPSCWSLVLRFQIAQHPASTSTERLRICPGASGYPE